MIIRHHHERFDGTGYPDGLKKEEIPFLARILSVADAYDAMNSDRAYRKKMEISRILKIIKEEAGTQFDPDIVDAFLKVHDKGLITQNIDMFRPPGTTYPYLLLLLRPKFLLKIVTLRWFFLFGRSSEPARISLHNSNIFLSCSIVSDYGPSFIVTILTKSATHEFIHLIWRSLKADMIVMSADNYPGEINSLLDQYFRRPLFYKIIKKANRSICQPAFLQFNSGRGERI